MGVLLPCHQSNALASRKQYSSITKAVLQLHESIETAARKRFLYHLQSFVHHFRTEFAEPQSFYLCNPRLNILAQSRRFFLSNLCNLWAEDSMASFSE